MAEFRNTMTPEGLPSQSLQVFHEPGGGPDPPLISGYATLSGPIFKRIPPYPPEADVDIIGLSGFDVDQASFLQ